MEKLLVNAPSKSYDIVIGWNIIDEIGAALMARNLAGEGRPVAVLTSPIIGDLYFDAVNESLEKAGISNAGRYDIPDGEKHKNLNNYCRALNWLSGFTGDPGLSPLVITLGGGVVGDLGGFVAHTYKRGVAFVQVTTTLLGAVDCSVGGKVAVNLPSGKNLVGAFHQPSLVVADLNCLRTLPGQEIRSGMAEVIKYGAALDAELFEMLEKNISHLCNMDGGLLETIVKRCCEIKAKVVRLDEFDDKGVRIALNFGHTVGHAIENVCGYALTHGECVAIGMSAAARLSMRLSLCGGEPVNRLESLLSGAGLPVKCNVPEVCVDKVLEVMKRDKKWVRGTNRFVLLKGPGSWKEVEGIEEDIIREVVEEVIV